MDQVTSGGIELGVMYAIPVTALKGRYYSAGEGAEEIHQDIPWEGTFLL